MMVRFFGSDQVLQLSGLNINTSTKHGGVVVSNVIVPTTAYQSMALFIVTEEQIAMFENGVAKIRITTVPISHERTFKKDKIGAKIYQAYKKVKKQNENF